MAILLCTFRSLIILPISAVILLLADEARGQVRLTLDDIGLNDGTRLNFITDEEVETIPPVPNKNDFATSQTAHFTLYGDFENTTYSSKSNLFIYQFYISPRPSTNYMYSVHVKRRAQGSFPDQIFSVEYTVTNGGLTERGTMEMPIHFPLYRGAIASSPSPLKPYSLYLSSKQVVPIPLSNRLERLSVFVEPPELIDDPGFWKTPPTAMLRSQTNPVVIPSGLAPEVFDLQLEPGAFKAIAVSLLNFGDNKVQRTLRLNIRYRTEKGGPVQTLPLDVPFVFYPNAWHLLTALIFSTLMGSLVPTFRSSKKSGFTRWLRLYIVGIVAAFVLTVTGVIMDQYTNTRIILLGLPVNPTQLTPALLVGLIAGAYGFRPVDGLFEWLKKQAEPTGHGGNRQ